MIASRRRQSEAPRSPLFLVVEDWNDTGEEIGARGVKERRNNQQQESLQPTLVVVVVSAPSSSRKDLPGSWVKFFTKSTRTNQETSAPVYQSIRQKQFTWFMMTSTLSRFVSIRFFFFLGKFVLAFPRCLDPRNEV
jgi:hypothetical protein